MSDTLSNASAKAESKSKNFIRWHNGGLLFYSAAPPEEIFIRFGIVPDFAKTCFASLSAKAFDSGSSAARRKAHIYCYHRVCYFANALKQPNGLNDIPDGGMPDGDMMAQSARHFPCY